MLAYVMPPAVATPRKAGREVVFVIDNSGSMGGTSIEQARASLDYALSRLEPSDRFNVIRFDNTITKFFSDSVMATAENIASARRFVTGLEAAGGTEMLPPLQAALDDSHQLADCASRVPDGRRGQQRAAASRCDREIAWTLSHLHGRHRLGAEHVPDEPRRRTRSRQLHPHRLGRRSERTHACPLRQAGEPGCHRRRGCLFAKGCQPVTQPPARHLPWRTAGSGGPHGKGSRNPDRQRRDR